MKHSLGTAAIATGKSKTTIHRAIKSGKLSAFKNDDGAFEIDPSELHRVFDPVTHGVTGNTTMEQSVTPDVTALLAQENDFLRLQLEREREFNRDLQLMLKTESEERRKLTALLTYQKDQTEQNTPSTVKTNSLFAKIFKKDLR
ncbi:hypothetical protein LBMAG43_20890 [Methylococcaceae bacterium]|nr:hypothetical protein LBMAG43_20890 [Methylococcaceae bacterium]